MSDSQEEAMEEDAEQDAERQEAEANYVAALRGLDTLAGEVTAPLSMKLVMPDRITIVEDATVADLKAATEKVEEVGRLIQTIIQETEELEDILTEVHRDMGKLTE